MLITPLSLKQEKEIVSIASHNDFIHLFTRLSRLQLGNRSNITVVSQKSYIVEYNLLIKVIGHKCLGHMHAKVI